MHVDVQWVSVTDAIKSGKLPAIAFERPAALVTPGVSAIRVSSKPRTGEFWTLGGDVFASKPDWGVTTSGDVVRVPMVSYRTLQPAVASVFGLGVSLGVEAVSKLQGQTRKSPVRLVLLLGDVCPQVEDAFHVFIGLSFQVEE